MSTKHARHRADTIRSGSTGSSSTRSGRTALTRYGRRAATVVVVGAVTGAATLGLAAPAQAHWLVTPPPVTAPASATTTTPVTGEAWPIPDTGIRATLPTTLGPVTTWRTPTAAVATGNAGALRNAIIATAQTGVGHRYLWGGTSPVTGWDCGGYVSWVLRQHGFDLPVLGGDAMATALGAQQIPLAEGRPGDIIWIPGHHIGIYDGNGGVYEALNPVQGTMHVPYHGGLLIRLPVKDS
ncbi:NlpC/P60 family protein [Tersicoccus sp. MR15.9]|uniref:C40 family peptidase n=1 Tax=Tersicoccus mangrovi TaxID=3121635 RepID=UPI002FE51708